MAWTTTDLTDIETAIRAAMSAGYASYTVPGRSAQRYTLKELRDLRNEIKAELAAENANSFGGMRIRKTIPPAAG